MIKTVDQYLESLNDGRQVWCLGEKVSDVRTHPTLSSIIKTAGMDYVLPKTPQDLLRRRECDLIGARQGGVMVHCMGADALAVLTVAAKVMDKEMGTQYTERVENYRKLLYMKDQVKMPDIAESYTSIPVAAKKK